MESVGIHVGLEKAETPEALQRLAQSTVDAGIRWTRQTFEWRVAEKSPDSYDWGVFDQAVETATRFDINILGVVITSPFGHAPASDDELARFSNYIRSLVARYKDRIRYWEVWNEPNLRRFWSPRADPRAYAAALKVAYQTLKKTDPTCTVLGMSTLGTDITFIRRVMEAGGSEAFDILSVHPYRDLREIDLNNDRPDRTMRKDMAILRDLLAEFGRTVPIWFTEMGRNTSLAAEGEGVSWETQAHYSVKMHVMALATGVEKLFQYELYAPATTPENKEYYYGILNPDYSPKPAYYALRTMTSKLAGLKYYGAVLPEDNHTRGYLFNDAGHSVVVMWSDTQQARVTLPVGSPAVQVTDYENREQTITTANGLAILTLTSSPSYLEGFDEEIMRRFCALSVRLPWGQTTVQEWNRVECTISNPFDTSAHWSLKATGLDGARARIRPREGVLSPGVTQPIELSILPRRHVQPGNLLEFDLDFDLSAAGGKSRTLTKRLHLPVDPGWLVCGPFPNPGREESRPPDIVPTDTGLFIDHLAGAGGEATIKPVEGQSHPGALGTNASAIWKKHPLDQRGFIDFRHSFDVRRNATAYAYRKIYSNTDRLALVRIGSDDGIRMWLNHQEVFQKHVHREAHVAQDKVTVHLRKGVNPCLIKVDQGSWGWGAYVEVEDESDARR